jgi:hypothetical protein
MAKLTIKKLLDPVYLSEHARFEKMRESNEELERLVASMPPMEDSTPLIREDRDRDN